VDEKQRNVLLTEEGYEAAEDVLQVRFSGAGMGRARTDQPAATGPSHLPSRTQLPESSFLGLLLKGVTLDRSMASSQRPHAVSAPI
jgi:preprotein translocase subunit SecA